jgi:DNA-binding transcriptional MerR regulator/effector-binding domain-containing protein
LDKDALFSIGQTAKLFNLSVGTLRHYETLGLVRPEYIDPETGYRYYSVRQFEPLNTVRYLRMLDMPLPTIGEFLKNRDIDAMEQKLIAQKAEIEKRKTELENIERKIDNRLSMINDAKSAPLDIIEEKKLPQRRLLWLEKPIRLENALDMELPIRKLDVRENTAGVFGKVGVGISRENLLGGRYDKYNCVFLVLDDEENIDGARVMPEARCVCLRYTGSHKEAAAQYEKLAEYMRAHGLRPAGFSREVTMIDYGLTNDPEKFVTQISIPVEEI